MILTTRKTKNEQGTKPTLELKARGFHDQQRDFRAAAFHEAARIAAQVPSDKSWLIEMDARNIEAWGSGSELQSFVGWITIDAIDGDEDDAAKFLARFASA